jgi:glycosyltransferase involved in cell wall biosynthesis
MEKNLDTSRKINIYFTWTDLPVYGYFVLKFLHSKLKKKNINFKVLSTETFHKENYRENSSFFRDIKWISSDKKYTWDQLGLEIPDIYFQSGSNIKSFNYLAKITSENKNSKLIFCADNIPDSKNITQFLKNLIFKLFFKNKYQYALVPGALSKQFMINLGFNNKEIYTGIYSALQIYRTKERIQNRKKQFIYVGQFIERKNLQELCKAFSFVTKNQNNWKLILVGNNNTNSKKLKLNKNIEVINYLSASKLLNLYNESTFFILPSLIENWGLVVHEASKCGCFLILSNKVGSICEFTNKNNTILFNPKSSFSIVNSIKKAISLKNKELIRGSLESQRLSKLYNYDNLYCQFMKIVNKCLKKNIIIK